MPFVFIMFIIIPIIEITLLINIGQIIGAWYTVGLVLFSAFVGVNMLRYQGLSTLNRAQQKMRQGEMPQQEMIEGLILAVGGVLLITPGFVTDLLGFCCLLPFTRIGFIKLASAKFKNKMSAGGFTNINPGADANPFGQPKSPFNQTPSNDNGDVFEGEFTKQQSHERSLDKKTD